MAKTEKIQARIEPKLKHDAEKILERIGLSTSDAITVFFRQIIMHNGIPFELALPGNGDKERKTKKGLSIRNLGKHPIERSDDITDMSVNLDKYLYS